MWHVVGLINRPNVVVLCSAGTIGFIYKPNMCYLLSLSIALDIWWWQSLNLLSSITTPLTITNLQMTKIFNVQPLHVSHLVDHFALRFSIKSPIWFLIKRRKCKQSLCHFHYYLVLKKGISFLFSLHDYISKKKDFSSSMHSLIWFFSIDIWANISTNVLQYN